MSNVIAYEQYIKNENWKCSKSPTSAHHWIVSGGYSECKYCHKIEKVEYRSIFMTNRSIFMMKRSKLIADKNTKL